MIKLGGANKAANLSAIPNQILAKVAIMIHGRLDVSHHQEEDS